MRAVGTLLVTLYTMLLALTFAPAGVAMGPEDPPTIVTELDGSSAEVVARESARVNGDRYTVAAARYAANPFVYSMVPACLGNSPATGGNALCEGATLSCPPGEVLFWLFRASEGTAFGGGDWEMYAQRCQAAQAPGSPPVVVPGLTLEDFQRLPLPAGTTNIEPDNGYTLINVPTNVYVTADPVVLDTDLLGFAVQVRATPASYTWDFGDGVGLGPTDDPGAPYPDLRTTHTYPAAGAYAVTLTTSYTGEYSVAGGPWLPVPGQAQVTSAPVQVQALSGRTHLVADPVGD